MADIYSIAAHPERPFQFLSTSRDTSMRTFSLEGIATTAKVRYRTRFTSSDHDLIAKIDRYSHMGSSPHVGSMQVVYHFGAQILRRSLT